MDFLAQVIADLARLVTFQQRRTPAPPPNTDRSLSELDAPTETALLQPQQRRSGTKES